ncbi:NAD-dependent epimerase/dehydratase family protein [Phycobacter azelaicus]|uniref:NAD-dependent epimerase/dehydratase family protein n=1 Tax=Phycobacter azelaicus TaxID=2668075 RepID=UPI001866D4B6|nr:NAD(P)-dependent oxidoreductase [Phycobacter azelaicus]MBE1297522.1 NAD-dependent epimerase/dehydratase family protein [Paracoccaceae bacterium]
MSASPKHILMTGSTGFVGRAVTKAAHGAGHRLCHVVRTGSADRIPVLGAEDRVIEVPDVFAEPAKWWAEVMQGQDLALHMAWYAEAGKYQTSPKNTDCLIGTLAMAQGAIAAQLQRFVGVGTCLEYDLRGTQGTRQSVGTDGPLNPQSPYAAAKAACALALGQSLPQAGVEFLWARLFYLHGDGEDPRRLVAALHQHLSQGQPIALTSGRQVRDFLDVADAAKMLVNDAVSDRCGISNICSQTGITVRALAEHIADQYGRRDLLQFDTRPDNPDDPPFVVGHRGPTQQPLFPQSAASGTGLTATTERMTQ